MTAISTNDINRAVTKKFMRLANQQKQSAKSFSRKVFKYILKNQYLHISVKGSYGMTTRRFILPYLYCKDKTYIRKYKDISMLSRTLQKEENSDFLKCHISTPNVENLIKISKFGWLYYSSNISESMIDGNLEGSVNLYFFGKDAYKNRHEFFQICKKSMDQFTLRTRKFITVLEGDDVKNHLSIKSEDDIIFRDIQFLKNSIASWGKMKSWYDEKHIAYKLSILLYGKPGTGKTSLINYIANITNRDMVIINLSKSTDDIKRIICEKSGVSISVVFVFEDIDILLNSNHEDNAEKLQYLLQLFDGSLSFSDSIMVMTTNHPEMIDERLTRKGRIDISLEVKEFNKEEAIRMCNKFQVDPSLVMYENETIWNPAELQSRCIEVLFIRARELINQKGE